MLAGKKAPGGKPRAYGTGNGKRETAEPSAPGSPGAAHPKAGNRKSGSATAPIVREIERAVRTVKLYPVAVGEDAKEAALKSLRKAYAKGGDSVRQNMLFLIHETIAQAPEMKLMRTYEHFRAKSPKQPPGVIRMSVYREMFDYTTSLEGLCDIMLLLGSLEGDEPAKLLTHFFSSLCATESEMNRMLRNAAIEALGKSGSPYALRALLAYARLSDSDKLFGRLAAALEDWADRIDKLDIPEAEKRDIRDELEDMVAKEEKPTQYG
jgi:hypothetical protein